VEREEELVPGVGELDVATVRPAFADCRVVGDGVAARLRERALDVARLVGRFTIFSF